ncbi:MAG: ornithine cyclodeaminase family protein [Alphaproteobacteria bacterium]|nr:ornithine cyclodeaminase family protein [Alphaproteobacteria bacterium]
MTRFLDSSAVAKALPWPAVIEAVETMLKEGCTYPPRQGYAIPVPGEPDATLLTMPAWIPGSSIGVKVVNVFPGNSGRGLAAVNGIYVLFDGRTGQPSAIMDADELTVRRTAAASAIAARRLARADAKHLLIVGTGRLAPALGAAHAQDRSLDRVSVWGRDPRKAAATARALQAAGLPADPAGDLARAAQEADLISCATLATEPLILGEWLRSGTHLDLVGAFKPNMREADSSAMKRADLLCVDTRPGALAEAGDIVIPMSEGAIGEGAIAADLRELVLRRHPGRTSAKQITIFKSVGFALEDLAAARTVAGHWQDPPQ